MAETQLTVQHDDHDRRLDRIARRLLPGLSLSRVYHLIRIGRIRVNGRKRRPSDRVAEGDTISLFGLQAAGDASPEARKAPPGKPPASLRKLILWESENLLALNKPKGILVHGEGSLDEAVKSYLSRSLPPSLSFRPGPLHRLDRNTSGVLFFSKSLAGARAFSQLLQTRRLDKYYIAVVDGRIARREEWRDRLERRDRARRTVTTENGGSEAFTIATPLAAEGAVTLAFLHMKTGRTHQIRAQAAHHRHPLSGDRKYGGSGLLGSYLLHAWAVRFAADASLGISTLCAPLPRSSRNAVEVLFGEEVLEKALREISRLLST